MARADTPADTPYTHYTFWHSHFCEKTRWALEYKRAPVHEKVLVPVYHALPVMLMTGQRQVPFVRRGDFELAGSTAILEHLEAAFPDPPLYPTDPTERAAVDAQIEWFDRELAPGIRRAVFFDILPHTGYLNRVMARPYGGFGRAMYRLTTPLNKLVMRFAMKIDAEGAARGREITMTALERVAAAGDGYLVGDRFTAADLTAAALLYITAEPPEGPEILPDRPPAIDAWLAAVNEHPGVAWVRRIYAEHRHPAA